MRTSRDDFDAGTMHAHPTCLTITQMCPPCRTRVRKRPSIFIVESRQNTRTFLEMTLSQEGVRVFSAVSLNSALLQLRVLKPDLIIIGFDRHDWDECSALAQINLLSAAPVLVLGDGTAAAPESGIADVLPYSPNAAQLCAKVAALLGGWHLSTQCGSKCDSSGGWTEFEKS